MAALSSLCLLFFTLIASVFSEDLGAICVMQCGSNGACPSGYTCAYKTNQCCMTKKLAEFIKPPAPESQPGAICVGPCSGGQCAEGYACAIRTNQCCLTKKAAPVEIKQSETNEDCPQKCAWLWCPDGLTCDYRTQQCCHSKKQEVKKSVNCLGQCAGTWCPDGYACDRRTNKCCLA